MQKFKDVKGSKEAAARLIIGKDTVYLHNNVKKCEDLEDGELYVYDEIQMTKDEYLEALQDKLNIADKTIGDLMVIVGNLGGEI